MLFNSIAFFGFLVVALAVYWLVPKRAEWQNAMLVMAGAAFYAFWGWRVLALFVGSAAVTYLAARSGRKGMSASSIGVNYHEANRSKSRDEFVHKVAIAEKEASESCYWFKVLTGLCGSNERLEALSRETGVLRNLLLSILKRARSFVSGEPKRCCVKWIYNINSHDNNGEVEHGNDILFR